MELVSGRLLSVLIVKGTSSLIDKPEIYSGHMI